MLIAPLPDNEAQRLADLFAYDILDSRYESDFDHLVELASYVCQSPVSLITLLDRDRQWFKAKHGYEGTETHRDVAFCSHAILQDEVMVVEDASKDERFRDNPVVNGENPIKFYAGAPILSPSGYKLGTICVLDYKPRTLSTEARNALELISAQVTRLLEIKRKNKELRLQAQELAGLKSLAIQKLVTENENDKLSFAHSLHEDFAQSITTAILYLHLSEPNESIENQYVGKAQHALEEVLNRMRHLTYKITPTNINWLDSTTPLSEYFHQTKSTYAFNVRVSGMTATATIPKRITLLLIRLSAAWLALLDKVNGVNSVTIKLVKDAAITLTITDNLKHTGKQQKEQLFATSMIAEIATSFGGQAFYQINDKSVCSIVFPIEQKTRKTPAKIYNN